jgi:hypothetical protein
VNVPPVILVSAGVLLLVAVATIAILWVRSQNAKRREVSAKAAATATIQNARIASNEEHCRAEIDQLHGADPDVLRDAAARLREAGHNRRKTDQ